MKIAELDGAERPREKLRRQGVRSLTNAELVAVLIRTGTGGKNAVELAQELLRDAGWRLGELSGRSLEALCRQKGMGVNKALSLQAAFELGRRAFAEKLVADKTPVTTPEAVYRRMLPRLRGLDHEECWALYLNTANYPIVEEKATSGGLSVTIIDTKAITRRALETRAASVILVHNHPSGNPLPGEADLRETLDLRKALSTFHITLTDHVIVAEDRFYSFADERIGP